MGTSDPMVWFIVPKVIDYVGLFVLGGWFVVMVMNRVLAFEVRVFVCVVVGTALFCPEGMVGSIVSIVLSDGFILDIMWCRFDPI